MDIKIRNKFIEIKNSISDWFEKPGIHPMIPGLQADWLYHYARVGFLFQYLMGMKKVS